MLGLVAFILGLFAAAPAPAKPPVPLKAGAPKLVVVISVDQFSADLFDEYRPHFTGGFARLANGTAFHNGYQAHAATETCPGHSTILTGSHPTHTGIIGNTWVDQSLTRSDRTVYCAEDERVPGSSTTSYTVSPMHLRVSTLGDLLKQQSPQSMNVAVAGKDRAAVMMSGHNVDQRWYWDGKTFATDLKLAAVPATITRAKSAIAAAIATAREPLQVPPMCQVKAAPVAVSPEMSVGSGRFARAGGDIRGFRASPEFDGAVLAIAAGLIQEMKLGTDAAPDVISVGLSATDYIGHSLGAGGGEMCLQLLSLDRDLAGFFRVLDAEGIDYAVVLTADHGGMDIPERLRAKGITQAARADPALGTAEIGKAIAAKLKLSGPVLLGDLANDVWIDRSLKPRDRIRVEREAIAIFKAHPQVEAVFTSRQIARLPIPTESPDKWTTAQKIRASFDAQRSGDLYVVLKKYVSPITKPSEGYVATHGSVWDYDRRVPILMWRKGMRPSDRQDHISTVNILPTIAAEIGLALPTQLDGRCLNGVEGVACPVR
ncbi:alkaline phosphatase family protein [Sphingomonas sediminicola]|uniref:Alkaline phosphatase n=1 Tax=Sphingomonas sediminicola TaxID=386874 RepID=A0ABX6T9U6_9SPHN|nr:alkaline phosphatase family protein [Sphingomonas sediminicola]QNP46622.1 alkaline phosphatase family protein [Sphingomonas sediminicola]